MRRAVTVSILGVVVLATASTACAGAEERSRTDRTAEIVVTNDIHPPTSVSVWIEDEGGSLSRLGSVSPGETADFSFRPRIGTRYRLVARTTSGAELVSHLFRLNGGERASWDLSDLVVPPGVF